jgi:predicted nucleic acid-binding protein
VTRFVVDASVAVAWCIDDEATPFTRNLLGRAVDNGIVVPSLWFLEMANVLRIAEKKSRVARETTDERLFNLAELIVAIDDIGPDRNWLQVLKLSRQHDLTSYDACYIAVALQHALPLASLDRAMIKAAKAESLTVLA